MGKLVLPPNELSHQTRHQFCSGFKGKNCAWASPRMYSRLGATLLRVGIVKDHLVATTTIRDVFSCVARGVSLGNKGEWLGG